MITTFLPASDRVVMPWKNGGGVTREIAAWPAGAGLDDFDWRISMAEVTAPGAFSAFADIERTLTVLDGILGLTFAGEQTVFLDAGSQPLTFAGDCPCHGLPVAGPVLDFNLMVRRGRFHGEVERVSETSWRPSGQSALLIALEPLAVGAETLNRHDALMFTDLDGPDGPPLHVGGHALAVSLKVITA